MFRKIDIKKRLPEIGKYVTTIDTLGNHRVYQFLGDGAWSMRDANAIASPPDNMPITHWLEEVVLDSKTINSGIEDFFNKELDWISFQEGWITGRMDLGLGSTKKQKLEQ